MLEQVKVVAIHDYPGIYEGDILTLNAECNLYEKQERFTETNSEVFVDEDGNERNIEYVNTYYKYVGLSAAEVEVNLVSKLNPNGIFEYHFEDSEETEMQDAISYLASKVAELEETIKELVSADEKRK